MSTVSLLMILQLDKAWWEHQLCSTWCWLTWFTKSSPRGCEMIPLTRLSPQGCDWVARDWLASPHTLLSGILQGFCLKCLSLQQDDQISLPTFCGMVVEVSHRTSKRGKTDSISNGRRCKEFVIFTNLPQSAL